MRTRSAARGADVTVDAKARTVDMFEGAPAAPPTKPSGLKFYKCACALVQVWGSGACMSCKKSLVGCPQVPERDVPQSQDVVRDVASPTSARDRVAAVFGSTAPRVVPTAPMQLSSPSLRSVPLALEQDLSALCIALEKRGVVLGKGVKALTVAMVAKWTPEMRRDAAIWCERMGDRPTFLENGVDDDGDPNDNEVVVDEDGDARTRAEMREKHADEQAAQIACTTGDIDATSPEMRAVLEPEAPKTRRRVVHGEASRVTEAAKTDPGDLVIEKLLPADTLTVTWGEEKFTPIPGSYSTCSIGPFSTTLTVMPGESNAGAFRRASEFLAGQAKAEKDRKLREFVAQLEEMTARVRR